MFSKALQCFKGRRMPWRLRIALTVCRGFLRDPRQALRLVSSVNVDMKSLYRYKLHIHGKDMMRDVLQEAEKLGMRPFLLWGTLLGLVREGRFLDHDYDIDFGILGEDYGRKDALIRAVLSRGYVLRFDHPYSFSFNTRDGLLHLDFTLIYPFKGKFISSMPSEDTGRITANEYPKEAFRTLERRRFLDLDVWVPCLPEKLLETIYGEWRVPVKNYDYRTGPRNSIPDPEALGIGLRSFSP